MSERTEGIISVETTKSGNESTVKKKVRLYDAKGEVCPYPAMYAKAILQDMEPGEILEVEVDHLCAVEGIPAAVKMLGHRVLKTENISTGIYRITVEVMGDSESS